MLIDVENLKLTLSGTQILKDVRLHVESNQIYGLIGPNGAGKSSTIFVILGLYAADGGKLGLFGKTGTPSPNTRRRIGVMPEQGGFYDWMNALDYLTWYAGLYGGVHQPIPGLLEDVGLSNVAARPIGQFSHGMRQRLSLARALVHNPELLILDEPTNGLDPRGRRLIHDLLLELAEQRGMGILLCTHLLDDVERLCSRVGIIHHGRTVLEGPLVEVLRQSPRRRRFRLRIEARSENPCATPPGVSLAGWEGNWCHLVVDEDNHTPLHALWKDLLAHGWKFTEIHAERGGLEELFLRLTTTTGDHLEEEAR